MVDLKEVYLNFFKNKNISLTNEVICIAVSCGVDSSVLLDLSMKYANCRIVVCHVNHGVRSDSVTEEEYITSFCKENDITLYVHHIKESDIKGNFQSEARNIRYNFFKEVMQKEGAKYLLLAHHLNDDIETMMFRLERGSSLEGYSGIEDMVKIDTGYILRPLLTVLKSDIYNYAEENDIKYFEDCTNREDHYDRNKIRHNEIPKIFKEIENASLEFLEMKKNIKEASCILNEYRDKLIENTFKRIEKGYKFNIKEFLNHNPYMQKEILFEICKWARLSSRAVDEMIDCLKSNDANIMTYIGKVVLIKSYDYAYVLEEYTKVKPFNITLDKVCEGEYTLPNGVKFKVTLISGDKLDNTLGANRNVLCYNSVYMPITLSNDFDGEMAMEYGTKKIRRMMIDKKVDFFKKEKAVVVRRDDSVLMVSGIEKSKISFKECADIKNCNFKIEFLGD